MLIFIFRAHFVPIVTCTYTEYLGPRANFVLFPLFYLHCSYNMSHMLKSVLVHKLHPSTDDQCVVQ